MSYAIDRASGYFLRDGERFVPFGVNYWPASCGTDMWVQWPLEEIRADLRLINDLGMNAIRIFLRWPDFQPAATRIESGILARLATLLGECESAGIAVNVSLFVGWMSGSTYYPEWKGAANMFTDSRLIRTQLLFVDEVSRVLRRYEDNIFAIDLGNELNVLEDSRVCRPSQISQWIATICESLRKNGLTCPILSGCDHWQVLGDTGWRFDNQIGCDLFSIHAYPIPNWLSMPYPGRDDLFGQLLFPGTVAYAAAYGPVFLQEFGTLGAAHPDTQRRYLHRFLPEAWAAGANGFLWWCLHDFDEHRPPYRKCPIEAHLGLVDQERKVKPGLEPFLSFGRNIPTASRPNPQIDIYIPLTPYMREVTDRPTNDPTRLANGLLTARFLLSKIGRGSRFTRSFATDRPLVVAGARLDVDELRELGDWVRSGGQLIYTGVPSETWGTDQTELLGAEVSDLCTPHSVQIEYGTLLTVTEWPDATQLIAAPTTAEVLAQDEQTRPIVFRNRLGRGTVVWTPAAIEQHVAKCPSDGQGRERWAIWYAQALADAAR